MSTILEAQNVLFKDVISYPHICISSGITTFIQGKSGCGKSTLLKLFNATANPTVGDLFYDGKNIKELDTIKLRQEVLLASQNVFLFCGSVSDNFKQFYNYRNLSEISDEKIKEYLDICCSDFCPTDICDNMSGGERQRIYIAVCLSLMPKVLMLDEPTSALDDKTSRQLLENVKGFCSDNDITLIAVSHNLELCQEFADDFIVLTKEGD
ncbi:MAG: ATP-binding cassette domain-containing protein [Oscillospiraceae bacterium]